MSKDFARAGAHGRGRSRERAQGGSAKGPFLAGLTLGLTVALGVFLVDHGYVDLGALLGETSGPPQPVPRAAEAPRPRFDFYTILPEMEVVIPEGSVAPAPTPAVPAAIPAPTRAELPAAETPGGYILQAGSFRSAADADGLKAQLALLGYEAAVQRVSINQDTYHRVRLGPFADVEAANAARARLGKSGVSTILLRLKG
jgi:cell division protein FtsN